MSPVAVVEDFKSDLLDEFPRGRGMVYKERILEILDEKLRKPENETDDSIMLLRQSIEDDIRGCFTYLEILTKVISAQRDTIDEGDIT